MRFPEFSGEWEQYSFGRITELFSRRNKERTNYPMYSVTNSKGFVNQQEQFEDRDMKGEDIAAYKIIFPGEFAYNPARINVGSIARYDGESACMISSLYVCFRSNRELVDSKLLLHILKSPRMVYNYGINGEGGVRIYLFYPNFSRIKVKLPSLKEQRKLAVFLDLIEERISKQNKVIEKYESLIKAITQQAQKKAANKSFLKEVLTERKELNSNGYDICSVSVSKGVINQVKYLGRSFAAKETAHYHVVQYGDIVYTKSPTGDFPYGIIKQSYCTNPVAVSPLYGVYEPASFEIGVFLHHLFCSPNNAINYLHPLIQKGAKNTINITNQHFLDNQVRMPDSKLLSHTVSSLKSISSIIRLEEQILHQLELQKQYMLSNMFI